jgi:hypothetical protein
MVAAKEKPLHVFLYDETFARLLHQCKFPSPGGSANLHHAGAESCAGRIFAVAVTSPEPAAALAGRVNRGATHICPPCVVGSAWLRAMVALFVSAAAARLRMSGRRANIDDRGAADCPDAAYRTRIVVPFLL